MPCQEIWFFLVFLMGAVTADLLYHEQLGHTRKNVRKHTSGDRDIIFPLFNNDKSARYKRGIVIIDEDFDKIPDVGVRQGWSDGKVEPDFTDATKETRKDSYTIEGSGSSLDEMTTFDVDSWSNITDTPIELVKTKEEPKRTTSVNILESSGDDDITSFSTTTTEQVINLANNFTLSYCLNFTCDDTELMILPGFAETIPEDVNLMLLCSMPNPAKGDILRWYKSNENYDALLESSSDNPLKFNVTSAKMSDSGTYVCAHLSKQTCCHRKLHVTVYNKPNYKYHLLTVGLVALVSLFTCLLLAIHRRYKIKQYKKVTKTQIQLNEFLL